MTSYFAGKTKSNPWKDVSAPIAVTWDKVWTSLGANHMDTDPLQVAADFYVLEAIANRLLISDKSLLRDLSEPSLEEIDKAASILGIALEKAKVKMEALKKKRENPLYKILEIEAEATKALELLVEKNFPIFFEYTHAACGGEVRHHEAVGVYGPLTGSRERAWATWHTIYLRHGEKAIKTMASLFREVKMEDASFMGEKWALAADLLLDFERKKLGPDDFTNKKIFLDRVFSLEHNTGCFLNKLDWTVKNTYGMKIIHMKRLLHWHAANPPEMNYLLEVTSKDVTSLYNSYVDSLSETELKEKFLVSRELAIKPRSVGLKQTSRFLKNGVPIKPLSMVFNIAKSGVHSKVIAPDIEVFIYANGNLCYKVNLSSLNYMIIDSIDLPFEMDSGTESGVHEIGCIGYCDGLEIVCSYALETTEPNFKIYGNSLVRNFLTILEQEDTK